MDDSGNIYKINEAKFKELSKEDIDDDQERLMEQLKRKKIKEEEKAKRR